MKQHESQKMLVLNDNELDIVSGGGIDRGDHGGGRGDRGGNRGGNRGGSRGGLGNGGHGRRN